MKKITIIGLTLIFLLALVACSANNTAEDYKSSQNEVDGSAVVMEAEQKVEPEVGAEVEATVEPEAEVEVVKPEKAEPEKVNTEKAEPKDEPAVVAPEKVEPKEQPTATEPKPVVATPKTHKVKIENFAFSPTSLEISVGDIVEFTNLDTVKHSVVEDSGVFDTGLFGEGESKQITFNEAGEFSYHCGPHPNMKASITVK